MKLPSSCSSEKSGIRTSFGKVVSAVKMKHVREFKEHASSHVNNYCTLRTLLLPYQSPVLVPVEVTSYILLSLPNVGFTALTFVTMSCRACGEVCDNLCMRSVATRESQRQALREILPLFILLSPSVTALAYIILQLAWKSAYVSLGQWFSSITIFIVGLLVPLSFAVHLCLLAGLRTFFMHCTPEERQASCIKEAS